ncbi:heat shock protein 30C-like [Malaclemys terrapin pileata]|uniref:heat shock protein 30C-like n=1 Tax=Malaclemys terrapin pileata TaxID=2991368 RepID=UPI0023A8CCF3|nr:heat shock protein 30C-like [Malaclemys terrapin pileata]
MLPLRVWLGSSAPVPRLLGPGPHSLLAQLVGDVQTHLEEMERLRHSLLLASPLLRGEGEGRRPRPSSRSLAEGAGKEPGSQAQGKDKFQLSMDVSGFSPAELMVRVDGRKLTVTGKQEKKTASEAGVCSHEYREIRRETLLPEDVNVEAVLCSLSQDGQLCIEAPHLALPAAEGRAVPISVCQGVKAGEGNLATEGKEPGSSKKMETGRESEGTSPRDF